MKFVPKNALTFFILLVLSYIIFFGWNETHWLPYFGERLRKLSFSAVTGGFAGGDLLLCQHDQYHHQVIIIVKNRRCWCFLTMKNVTRIAIVVPSHNWLIGWSLIVSYWSSQVNISNLCHLLSCLTWTWVTRRTTKSSTN